MANPPPSMYGLNGSIVFEDANLRLESLTAKIEAPRLQLGSVEGVSLITTGNVGIGTTNPQGLFQVKRGSDEVFAIKPSTTDASKTVVTTGSGVAFEAASLSLRSNVVGGLAINTPDGIVASSNLIHDLANNHFTATGNLYLGGVVTDGVNNVLTIVANTAVNVGSNLVVERGLFVNKGLRVLQGGLEVSNVGARIIGNLITENNIVANGSAVFLSGNVTIRKNLYGNGNVYAQGSLLNVSGNTVIGKNLFGIGNVYAQGSQLNVSGNAIINKRLSVIGNVEAVGEQLNVHGNAYIHQDLYTKGLVSAEGPLLHVLGNAIIDQTLDLYGNVFMTKDLTVQGNLTVRGTTTAIDTTNLAVKDAVVSFGNNVPEGETSALVFERNNADNFAMKYTSSGLEFIKTDGNAETGTLESTSNALNVTLHGDLNTGDYDINANNMTLTGIGTVTGDLFATSNLTVGGNKLFVNSLTSNVGIGTNAPTAKLEVNGAIRAQNVYVTRFIFVNEGGLASYP